MRSKRKHERFIRRLETVFTAENKTYRGISSDFSISGLFIRTNHPFAPGSIIDITIHLPDGTNSKIKGKVMRAYKTPISGMKNGMGIAFIEKDVHYMNFIKSFSTDIEEPAQTENVTSDKEKQQEAKVSPETSPQEFSIISCPNCGVKNKIPRPKMSLGPKCGKCGLPLIINMP